MLKLTWKTWLAIWLVIGLATAGLTALLRAQGAANVAGWTDLVGALLGTGWMVFGLIRWRDVPRVKRINTFALTAFGFGVVMLFFQAIGWQPGLSTTAYLLLAVVGFLLGINLLRLILRPGHPVLGVARTMIEEALRMGISLFFIVALLLMLVVMPLILGSEDRVTYMVQRFLVYSGFVVFLLLGTMTVLLGAYSVSKEISTRQVHMTLTKPLARWQYLLGKWLGIVLLDAVLVAVAGVAIYGFTMSIARNPALNDLDRYAVDREILTARLARIPDPINVSWEQMYRNVLEEKQQRDPDKFGEVGGSFDVLTDGAKQEVMADAISRFYTVDGGSSQEYKFTGLTNAVEAANRSIQRAEEILKEQSGLSSTEAQQYVLATIGRPNELKDETIPKVSPAVQEELLRELEREKIQLVLTPDTSPEPDDQFVEFYLKINNQPFPRPRRLGEPPIPINRGEVAVESPYEVDIPAGLISKDGTMIVTIEVPKNRLDGIEQQFVQFNYKDAQIELYYRVGSFESNLARAMLILWLKLCFLAMLGLSAGALLSFPVAGMLGLVVFVAAWASGVIDESLRSYAATPSDAGTWDLVTGTVGGFFQHIGNGEVYDAFRLLLRVIGEGFMLIIPSFGEFSTSDPLSTGRVIGGGLVISAVLKLGLLWTGVVGLIGLVFFHRKEIARVTV